MNGESDLVTVYRSADMNAEQDATAIRNLLIKSGVHAEIVDDDTAGVVDGTYEVRVPASEVAQAEALVATVDSEDPGRVDPSHHLDLVTIAALEGTTAEMEAVAIQSILDANGITALLVGSSSLPVLRFDVQVARDQVGRAEAILAEARAAGPAAAAEAAEQSTTAPEA